MSCCLLTTTIMTFPVSSGEGNSITLTFIISLLAITFLIFIIFSLNNTAFILNSTFVTYPIPIVFGALKHLFSVASIRLISNQAYRFYSNWRL